LLHQVGISRHFHNGLSYSRLQYTMNPSGIGLGDVKMY